MNQLKGWMALAGVLCAMTLAGQEMGMVRIEADPRIESLLRLRKENSSDGRLVDGFVIQIYYGRSQEASRMLDAFRRDYPDVPAKIEYDTPDYKVFVGAYRDEASAREALGALRQNPSYSGAFVRPKKITVFDW